MASNNFINECKNRAYENRLGKLSIDGTEYNQSNNLSSFEIENNIYSNGTIIGNTYSKSLKASLINIDKDTPFVGKTVSPSAGVKYSNNTTEYLDFDDYIVETINDKQTNNLTEITGYDTLDKLNAKYECGLDESESHTIGEYWNDLLLNLGFQTHTTTFTNSDIVIPANPFVNNETNRVVLSEIEKVSCNFSKITKDNGVHYIDLVWFDEKESKKETIEIDGNATITDMARITNLELQGDTYQTTTQTGKNLCPAKTFESLSSVRMVSTATSGGATVYGIPVVANQKYTASFDVTSLPSVDYRMQLINSSDSFQTQSGTDPTNIIERQQITCNQVQRYSVSLTTTQAGYLYLRCVSVGFVLDNIQIEKGDATSYEAYIPNSPSPNYPQEIQVVSGRQEVKVAGKNLFSSVWEQGYIDGTTGENSASNQFVRTKDYLYVIPNTHYAINRDITTGYINVRGYGKDKNFLGVGGDVINLIQGSTAGNPMNQTWSSCVIAPKDNVYYLRFNDSSNDLSTKYMMTTGDTQATYEAYTRQNYEINLGKNLLNIGTVSTTNNGITFTSNNDGSLTLSGLATGYAYVNLYISTTKSLINENVEYTYSKGITNTNIILAIYEYVNGSWVNKKYVNTSSTTYTPTGTQTGQLIRIIVNNGTDFTTPITIYPQLEKGNVATTWSAYKTPIELCKIGTYQDFIKKGTGKNLFDKSTISSITNGTISNDVITSNAISSDYGGVSANISGLTLQAGTYYLSMKVKLVSGTVRNSLNTITISSSSSLTKTITSNPNLTSEYQIYSASIVCNSETSISNIGIQLKNQNSNAVMSYTDIMISTSNDTSYEPYGTGWYIEKQIGKVVLNGSESWGKDGTKGFYTQKNDMKRLSNYTGLVLSNYFENGNDHNGLSNYQISGYSSSSSYLGQNWIYIKDDDFSTANDFKTWLSTHNTTVYYVLATPTYPEITDIELINQLEEIKFLNGLNNVCISSYDLSSTTKINYYSNSIDYEFQTSDYSTLDGGLIEYGPINSVVLGNKNISGENVVREDINNIQRDGEHSIFIDSEYFLFNQSLREQAIDGIWKKLYDFRYYDLSLSTPYGKPFLEVGDKIRVNTNEGNIYDTYILGHKFTFDGTFITELNSPAFTEQEQITKSTDSISSSIKNTEIMVDKANQRITSLVIDTEYNTSNISRVEQTTRDITTEISSIQGELNDTTTAIENLQIDVQGLTNKTISNGGTNLVRDSMGILNDGSWEGTVTSTNFYNAVGLSALLINSTAISQTIKLRNGTYMLSFKYHKEIVSGTMTATINGITHQFNNSDEENNGYTQLIEVSGVEGAGEITISFIGTVDAVGEVYDLMLNLGNSVKFWEQNQNETTTETVKIGKGIIVKSSSQNTTSKMNADGFRVSSNSDNQDVMRATDKGGWFRELESHSTSNINGSIFIKIDNQIWETGATN